MALFPEGHPAAWAFNDSLFFPDDQSETASTAPSTQDHAASQTARTVIRESQGAGAEQAAALPRATLWIDHSKERYSVALNQLAGFEYDGVGIGTLEGDEIDTLEFEVNNQPLLAAFRCIQEAPSSSAKDAKTLYRNFLQDLRSAVMSTVGKEAEIASALCRAHFAIDIKGTTVGTQFTDNILRENKPFSIQELDAERLHATMKEGMTGTTTTMKLAQLGQKLDANLPINSWDPASYSVRSKLAEIVISGKPRTFLRTACPVVGSNSEPEIDPLFIGMLRALKAEGKKYLYINNQSTGDGDSRFNESKLEGNRVAALRGLSNDLEFKGMFHVVSFAHDSTFYKGGDEELNVLKSALLNNLRKGTEGYFLPEVISQDPRQTIELHKKMDAAIESIHAKYFPGKENLTVLSPKERKEFLHIAYAAIGKIIIETLDIDTLNITCKDGVDRAAGSAANLMAYASDRLVPFDDLLWTLTFPAALNHERPPRADRHEPSIGALKLITGH